jgi:DUF917 family protein
MKWRSSLGHKGVNGMVTLRGLKKLFAKKAPFSSPNEYLLTSEEKEHVVLFFSVICVAALIIGGLLIANPS